ncbi:MAG TPA: hypothetical protein VFH77_14220 [Streptomyces sp.]|nr:hypothetical protein [Streptomyces sp.]
MSGLWRELRPYLVVWPAAKRLTVGTWRLACRLCSACMAGEGTDKAWRALGALAVAVFAWRVIVRAPVVELLLLAVWAVTAWRAGPKPKQAADEPTDQEHDEAGEEQPLPDLGQLTAALHHVADPHAHLAAAAAHLGEDPARVREAARQAGIPIGPVRVRGRGVSTGVKATDLPPLPDPPQPAPDDVVVAGQPATTPDAPIVEHPHPGMTIVRYPADMAARRTEIPR